MGSDIKALRDVANRIEMQQKVQGSSMPAKSSRQRADKAFIVAILAAMLFCAVLILYMLDYVNSYAVDNAKWFVGIVFSIFLVCDCGVKISKICKGGE